MGLEEAIILNEKDRREVMQKNLFEEKTEGKFVAKLLGDQILNHTHIKTLKGSKRMYYYSDGVYLDNGAEKVQALCAIFLEDRYTNHYYKETLSYIQAKTFIDPNEINNDWINLENGLLNPITKEFKDHSPEVFSTIRVPIIYDSEADCSFFKQKLKEKLDEQTIIVLQEMFGYCYVPKQHFESAFLFYGPMRTMKSTTLRVLEQLLGSENVAAHSLQYLNENTFGPAYLFGLPANICADLSSNALKNTAFFMQLTGGDKITCARKNEHPISFFPSTKLIFSANHIPPTTNKDPSFYRRWIILEFKSQTSKEEIDPDIEKKFTAELPGILNWALEGQQRLLEQNKFSYWLDEGQVKDLYEKSSDSIQSYIYNEIDMEFEEGAETKRETYKQYKAYCSKEGITLENQIKFGRMFIALTGCGVGKKGSLPAYKGIAFKNQKEGNLNDY